MMRAACPMLLLWCCVALAPAPAAAADRTGVVQLMPCAATFSVTEITSDRTAVMVHFGEPIGPFTGPITAYGSDRIWVGMVERTATTERYGVHDVSLELHADGPIEGVSYTPDWATCTFRAGTRPRTGYDRDATSPILTLTNPQPIAPTTCAHPYATAKVTRTVEPTTPAMAAQQGISGLVYVAVALDERGVPQAARVVTSPSPILNNASLAATMRSEYTAEVFRCRPVPGGYMFGIDFG